MFSKALIATTLLSAVSAHQNWHQLWINGKTPGYEVGIRMPPSNSPVTDVLSNDIACNVPNTKGTAGVQTVPANAGDTIKVQWDQSSHPGPITHMLFGPVSNASQTTGVGAGWFKIDELDYVGGKWANVIMGENGMTREFKLPTGLPSGEYLLRSEMLALHGSYTVGGGQFYIGCAQLKITGTNGGSCSPKISLPGAYNKMDKDIYIPNFYNGFDATTFKAPGGELATCGTGSGSAAPVTPVASSAPVAPVASPAAVTPVASPAPAAGAGGSSGSLPARFTVDTFISWLESRAAGSSGKARRHARELY